jgi:predicted DNA-binding transcriptional regulator AlpA
MSIRLRQPAAAKYCGVSESYLSKGRCLGYGPAYLKLGKAVVYDQSDLDIWLAEHRRGSTSDRGPAHAAVQLDARPRPVPRAGTAQAEHR